MTYRGHIIDGTIVLDEPADLPDGTPVTVLVGAEAGSVEGSKSTVLERLAPIVGIAEDMPPDASRNLDHYLYGAPRR